MTTAQHLPETKIVGEGMNRNEAERKVINKGE